MLQYGVRAPRLPGYVTGPPTVQQVQLVLALEAPGVHYSRALLSCLHVGS
jgi:hypothetical protein